MATIRRTGFGTIFEVENEKVGIGTTGNQTNTVQVLGETKTSNAVISGLSSLTTYQGFVDSNAEFGNSNVDINSQSGTLGNIEICHGDFNVSSASTLTSSVNELTVTNSFSVPTGDTDSRIHCHTAGSMRFNEDLGTLEFYTGDMWKTVNSIRDTGTRGRAVWAGGYDNAGIPHHSTSSIDYINVPSLGNSINFGELSAQGQDAHGCGSETRGVYMGKFNSDAIEYITIASEGDSIDFGNLTDARNYGASGSSSTRGMHFGGDNPSTVNTIDYIQINTLGDALDFGDLTDERMCYGGAMSNGRTISVGGGDSPVHLGTYDQITIAAKGNAIEFGELISSYNYGPSGNSNTVRGVLFGGQDTNNYAKQIQYITLSSGGNAQYFGDLSHDSLGSGAGVTAIRAVFAIGRTYTGPVAGNDTNILEYVSIATTGNAQDFGDLRGGVNRAHSRVISPVSDSHGGLGGY